MISGGHVLPYVLAAPNDMTMRKYILGGRDGHTPIAVGDPRACFDLSYVSSPKWQEELITWGRWMEGADRRVAQDSVWGVRVSTVFLGCDHRWNFDGSDAPQPILFETMVFGGVFDEYQERYCTWDEAVAGHATRLRMVRLYAIPSFFIDLYRVTRSLVAELIKRVKA